MRHPEDLPEDLWAAACRVVNAQGLSADDLGRVAPVARALMAEREACAVRAEALDRSGRDWVADSLWARIRAETATDIRKGA